MEDKMNVRLPWPGWTVVKYLGEGGYGRVYEIERELSGIKEQAALKVVSRPADDAEIEACYENGYDQASMKASYQEELQRYVKEYQLMKELQGQTNIVSCDDFAVVPRKDGIGGQIFIRMELLTPLKKATMQSMLSESEVIRLGKDICKALMLCEARHIIHRDIKPENILVSKFGDYKLGDFGVARVQDHTTKATKMGTHGYAAPEVEHGQEYGKEADIYSLGITLYWLLNNRRMPFLNADESVRAMKEQEALRRRYEGEKLPAPKNGSAKLKQVVLKACAYRPEDRYRSAQELYDALSELSGGHTDTASYAIPDCPVGINATDTSFGAGYSGKTEGNGWDDETKETIDQPKPKKKPSGASAGSAGKGQTSEPIEKTMGKAEAYKKQEKQMSERVAAMESVQASKKPWWGDWKDLFKTAGYLMAVLLLIVVWWKFQTNSDSIFDWIGQKISGNSVNYTFTYADGSGYVAETDENGNTVLVKNYDADGNLEGKELSEYDSAGNKISLTEYMADDQVKSIAEYDSQGRTTKYSSYDEGNLSYWVTTEYGEDGHRSSQNEYNADGQMEQQTTYEWVGDNIKKQVDTHYYGENGTVSGYRVLECDDNGNHVSDTQYDSEWNVTSYTTDYQYDADGNLLQCTEYNGDGSVSKKMVYYQQNEGDLLRKVRWYDADGNVTYDSGAQD